MDLTNVPIMPQINGVRMEESEAGGIILGDGELMQMVLTPEVSVVFAVESVSQVTSDSEALS